MREGGPCLIAAAEDDSLNGADGGPTSEDGLLDGGPASDEDPLDAVPASDEEQAQSPRHQPRNAPATAPMERVDLGRP